MNNCTTSWLSNQSFGRLAKPSSTAALGALLFSVLTGCGQGGKGDGCPCDVPGKLTATISFNLADAGTASNRALLGSNIEWVNQGDGLVSASGAQRPELLNVLRPTGATVLRYPGGSLADTYHWRDGIGPIGSRGLNRDLANLFQPVVFGTDELLKLAADGSATPLLTVNVVTASAKESADWVAYVNGAGQRVLYWEIGNEPYLVEDKRPDLALTPPQFAQRADGAITAMRAADPSIKVGLPLRSAMVADFPATPYPNYNNTVLTQVASHLDFVTVHNAYLPFVYNNVAVTDADLYAAAMAATQLMALDLNATAEQVKALRPERVLPMALTEYNVLFGLTPALLQKGNSLTGALYVADVLQVLANRNDILCANYWSLSGNGSFGIVDESGNPRPAYYVLQSYNRLLQGQVLPTQLNSPRISNPRVGVVPSGDAPAVTAVVTRSDKMLRVAVINKHASAAIDVALKMQGGAAMGGFVYWRLSGDEIFAGAPGHAAINWTTGSLAGGSGSNLTLDVPPHSLTLYEIPIR